MLRLRRRGQSETGKTVCDWKKYDRVREKAKKISKTKRKNLIANRERGNNRTIRSYRGQ